MQNGLIKWEVNSKEIGSKKIANKNAKYFPLVEIS